MSFERDARCKHGELNSGGSGGCPKCHEEEFGPPIEYVYTDVLKPEQQRYWRSIQWLVDWDIRGEGRSTLLTLAFIQQADKHPNREIPFWDHYDGGQSDGHAAERVHAMLKWLADENPEYFAAREFQVDRKRHTVTRIR